MKIVVAGGATEADFLIASLLLKKHQLVVINGDDEHCKYLAQKHGIPVLCGDPCNQFTLSDASIKGYDMIIALLPEDADNLAICQTAKRFYGIGKTVCTVSNPKNVDIFKKLGIDVVISNIYMIESIVEKA